MKSANQRRPRLDRAGRTLLSAAVFTACFAAYSAQDLAAQSISWCSTYDINRVGGNALRTGESLCIIGDVNDDGHPDFVVGAPDNSKVALRSGVDGLQVSTIDGIGGSQFGFSLASAGGTRFLVGAPDGSGGSGEVRLYQGERLLRIFNGPPPLHTKTRFGHAVAAADVNADGVKDLIVGAPGFTDAFTNPSNPQLNLGKVFVFDGEDYDLIWDRQGQVLGEQLGYSVAGANLTGNEGVPIAEVVAGAPFHSSNRGRVWWFRPLGTVWKFTTGRTQGEQYGYAVATVRTGLAQGRHSVVVGSPVTGTNAGAIHLHRPDGAVDQQKIGGANQRLGEAIASTDMDINGDGWADILVGAPSVGSTGQGSALVLSGPNLQQLAPPIPGFEGGDRFGMAVAAAAHGSKSILIVGSQIWRYKGYVFDDPDGDGRSSRCDNCPSISNADQANSDGDGFGNACDNCPAVSNPNQADADGDGDGDACDNCPAVSNANQADSDGDGRGNACDNCPSAANANQVDTDGDGDGDACDNCPSQSNPNQADADGDGRGNACDNCRNIPNANQRDRDGDGIGDACDNCPTAAPGDQTDTDGDGVGDICDNCVETRNTPQSDRDGDGIGDECDSCPDDPNEIASDIDQDGVDDACDNCPQVFNPGQSPDDCAVSDLVVGEPIEPPPGWNASAGGGDQLATRGSVAKVYYDGHRNRVFVVTAGSLRLEFISRDGAIVKSVEGNVDWPGGAAFQTCIVEAPPVELDRRSDVGAVELYVNDNHAELRSGRFDARFAGRSTLVYRLGRADPGSDGIIIELINSVLFASRAVRQQASIGVAITHPEHHPACASPWVVNEVGPYIDDEFFYDRDTRSGPLIAANAGTFDVIFYQVASESQVCWPRYPVRVDCEWPELGADRTIVIASEAGTGPLALDNLNVYREETPGAIGYNPNEEHAFVAPANGGAPRILAPSRIMVLEGSSTTVEARVLDAAALEGSGEPVEVAIDVSGARSGPLEDDHLTFVDPGERLVLDATSIGEAFSLSFAAALERIETTDGEATVVVDEGDSSNGSRTFTVRASGSLNTDTIIEVVEADTERVGLFADLLSVGIPEGESATVHVRLTRKPDANVAVAVETIGGDADLVADQSALSFTPENWDQARSLVITASEDDDSTGGSRSFRLVASGGLNDLLTVEVRELEPASGDVAVFALRSDLGGVDSEPYVLVTYTEGERGAEVGNVLIYKVVAEDPARGITFDYESTAGKLIQAPYPLNLLGSCKRSPNGEDGTYGVSGPFWEDRKGGFWARAAGFTATGEEAPSEVVLRFFYPVQSGFDFPSSFGAPPRIDDCVPWLDRFGRGAPGTPVDVRYTVRWPEGVPELRVGETLVKPKYGLPNITDQCSVEIIYEEASERLGLESVQLIEPETERSVDLEELPGDFNTELDVTTGKLVLVDLPPGLRERIRYDGLGRDLELKGVFDDSGVGEPLLVLNVLSERDEERLKGLLAESQAEAAVRNEFDRAVTDLAAESRAFAGSKAAAASSMALTAGFAGAGGYVTLAMQNDEAACGSALPVSLEVIRVTCPLYRGEIKVIEPECPFDEKLTLRHSGDFAGRVDEHEFEWFRIPAGGRRPDVQAGDSPGVGWIAHEAGIGAVETTLEDPPIVTLTDNWFTCRYRRLPDGGAPLCADGGNPEAWSEWTRPTLAEGWIKRVLDGVGPFEQLVKNFDRGAVDTLVSVIAQAGSRWEGSIALNCDPEQGFGLIEAYETVVRRGIDLSIGNGLDIAGANDALLLAAGRIADLYMLLGNEAYADAQDPTVGFGPEGVPTNGSSLHAFDNQTASLLEEELALLRGRSGIRDDGNPDDPVTVPPHYNRLVWNFTGGITQGEVAYALNYDISDEQGDKDGVISEEDARRQYPQGHGDAWGHYLTAIKSYYRLLSHPSYTWTPRAEFVRVGGVNGIEVAVDFFDERKLVKAAAARARCGAEIVNLTHRQYYTEDPEGQYQGYEDPRSDERAWGLSEWGCRAGQGAYLDWVVGNALLPDEDNDPSHEGIRKIDRTTVRELHELASLYQEIEGEVIKADLGVNPLGVARNVVPFDIDPNQLDQGTGHFEQVYDRAVQALNNAITVFNFANRPSQLLRQQQDTLEDFLRNIEERESDFNNRLIEIFGYPYSGDIPARGGIYSPSDVDRVPDLVHYAYVDPSELLGADPPPTESFTIELGDLDVGADGSLSLDARDVTFHIATNGFGLVKPRADWGSRRAPGEIQLVRSDLIQARARFDRAGEAYDSLLAEIESAVGLLEAQYDVNAEEIVLLAAGQAEQERLDGLIFNARLAQLGFRTVARTATHLQNAIAEALPLSVGMSNDVTSVARSAIMLIGSALSETANIAADGASLFELDHQQAKESAQSQTSLELSTLRQELPVLQQVAQLERLVRSEATARLDVFSAFEALQQTAGRYQVVLARGQRLLEDRRRFRRQTAAQVQRYRYRDMTFRIFRNDALQKYRAQFDLAARYVYLAATAYDYETNLLRGDRRGDGQRFLEAIVKERVIGDIEGGVPVGGGLAGIARAMLDRWESSELRGGFLNPQIESDKAFSLRWELFRIGNDAAGDALWRRVLEEHVVANIYDLREFGLFCEEFSQREAEPGIVIPFSSTITAGLNFFGNAKTGGDHSYLPENFTTKIRTVGVWFSGYNTTPQSGLAADPGVYLVPAGLDVMRSPTDRLGDTREWRIFDQSIPSIVSDISESDLVNAPSWIPSLDEDTLSDTFGAIRRFTRFPAAPGDGTIRVDQMARSSRLIGRSVWNSRWLLIIPAESLLADREEGLERFIHGRLLGGERDGFGVSDILIYFTTYAYQG